MGLSVRRKWIDPVAAPAVFDDKALRAELEKVCADMKEVRRENAALKSQVGELLALAKAPEKDDAPTKWDFEISRNSDGSIRGVKAMPALPETEQVNPAKAFFG